MILPKPIRKLIGAFRGDVAPLLIWLSVMLGFWFGLTPGWQGIHIVLLVVVLIVNVNLGLFILFAGLAKALSYAAAPVLYFVGTWTVDNLGFLLTPLAALPVLGLTDFSRYAVSGALVLGPLLGLAAGWSMAALVQKFRKAWLTLDERSEKFRNFQQKSWVRWLDWLLLGKRTKDVKAALEAKPKLVRMAGVITATVVLVISLGGMWLAAGSQLRGVVATQLGAANGAEVNLARFDFQPFAGRVTAGGVQITDPRRPTHDRFRVNELTADASLMNLLRGRVVVDEAVLGGVVFDAERETPGEVYHKPEDVAAEEPFERSAYDLPSTDAGELKEFFENGEQVVEKLKELAEWLPAREPQPAPPPTEPDGYLQYLTARAPQVPTPRVVVRKARFADVRLPAEEFGVSTIEAENVSDAPIAHGEPVMLRITSQERPVELAITNHYGRGESHSVIQGTIGDIELARLQEQLNRGNPVKFQGGTADASIAGTASRERLDLTVGVKTKGMQADATGGFFGLEPQVANEALKVLENLETNLRIVGPVAAPRIVFNGPALNEQFQQALLDAGKRQLADRLDAELEGKTPEGTPKASEVLDDPLGAGGKALEGFLGGQKKDDEE